MDRVELQVFVYFLLVYLKVADRVVGVFSIASL